MAFLVALCTVLMVLVTSTAGGDDYRPPPFRTVVIHPGSRFPAATTLDLNGDGHRDIVCGAFGYLAPHWRLIRLRDVPVIRGRYDDYSNLPVDVDGDGDLDIVSVNYRSGTVRVAINPSALGQSWQVIEVERLGRAETALLVDINGDGLPDILPNGIDYAAWYERYVLPAGPGVASFATARRPLPDQVRAHGIGAGDVDGDGLVDVVGQRGWARQVPGPGGTIRWQWLAEFTLHRDASIPILVVDVDGDGDSDLIWGRGHDIGVYWLEQRASGGRRTWQLHCIDHTISQVHALRWADLNADGRPELVAARRYLGHDGRDPGEYDPLLVRAYQFSRKTRSWHAATIAWDSGGWDLDPEVVDLDGDGDLDLIGPTRNGLYCFENRSAQGEAYRDPVPPADQVPVYHDRSNLLIYRTPRGTLRHIRRENLFDWGRRRFQILRNMEKVMGPLPGPQRRVPLDVQIVEEVDTQYYRRIKLFYTADPGDRVPAYLLVPLRVKLPAPAVLVLHQTNPHGKDELVGLAGRANRRYADELAREGFVCLVPDYPSFGEYRYDFRTHPEYVSGTMKAIWNNIRAIDLLESRPEVDRDAIAAFGHSLGGHNALFTAAFDQRIRAVVTSCGFTAFPNYYGGNLRGWTSDRYMPRIRTAYAMDPKRMPFDFHEVLAAIAPRPLFVNAPLNDGNFDNAGVREVIAAVRPVYRLFGAVDRLVVVYPNSGHDFPEREKRQAYRWLKAVLTRSR